MLIHSRSSRTIRILGLALAMACPPVAGEPPAKLNLYSSSGLVVIPDARIIEEGDIHTHLTPRRDTNDFTDLETWGFSLGALPGLEIGGRLVENNRPGRRDVSGHARFSFTQAFLGDSSSWTYYLPDLAIGIEDFGGTATNFRSEYVVMGKRIGPLVLSAGYGKKGREHSSVEGFQRLSGGFGGLELSLPWNIDLLADYADNRSNLGLRFSRLIPGTPVTLGAMIALTDVSEEEQTEISVELSVPMDFSRQQRRIERKRPTRIVADAPQAPTEAAMVVAKLSAQGFERIKVGSSSTDLTEVTLDTENFLWSVREVVGAIVASADRIEPVTRRFRFTLKRDAVPILQFDLTPNGQGSRKPTNFQVPGGWRFGGDRSPTLLFGGSRQTWLDLEIRPVLSTFVGSEVGVLDYDLGVSADLELRLGNGLSAYAIGTTPLARSDDYDDDFGAFRNRRNAEGLDEAALQFTARPLSFWVGQISGGVMTVFGEHAAFGASEHIISLGRGGRHLVRYNYTYAEDDNGDEEEDLDTEYEQNIGEYILLIPEVHSIVRLGGGRFFFGDVGGRLMISRFFGDTEIQLNLRRSERGDMSAGIGISLPLGPRKTKRFGPIAIHGAPNWSHSQSRTFNRADGSDASLPDLIRERELGRDLLGDLLDRGRAYPVWQAVGNFQTKPSSK